MYENIITVPPPPHNMPFCIDLAGISYCDGSYSIRRRKSSIFCIEIILKGTGTVVCDESAFSASAGQGYMLFPGSDHYYYSDSSQPWTKIWFNAHGKMINELAELYMLRGITVFENINIASYIMTVHRICSDKTYTSEEIHKKCAIVFHRIMQELSICKKHETSGEALILKNYIDCNIGSKISLDTLSGLIYRSRSQTIRIFKAAFGVTPYDYIIQTKIKAAKSLLKNTNMLVKEISYQLGFADEHYFTGVFKQKTGVTPKKYRIGNEE